MTQNIRKFLTDTAGNSRIDIEVRIAAAQALATSDLAYAVEHVDTSLDRRLAEMVIELGAR